MSRMPNTVAPAAGGAWRRRTVPGRGAMPFTLLAIAAGCASVEPAPAEAPMNAGQLAASASAASAPDAPYRIVFEWSLNEPSMRIQGRGVARIEPPYRARLDLFARNGERVTAAALVDGEFRLPEGLPNLLPPPTLFWGALGVFRPDAGMGLAGGNWRSDGTAELRYLPGEAAEMTFRLNGNAIQEIVIARGGRTTEDLRLRRGEGERFPREATYRDLTRTRELRMTIESVEQVETYPGDVWTPRR
jgi:hypothetical protein